MSIKVFTDGSSALPFLEENHADLVILDINMPAINGWQVLDKLRAEHIATNVIILSSSIDPSEKKRAFTYENVKSVMSKPLTREQLSAMIQSFNPFL